MLFFGYNTATKRGLPGVRPTTLLLGVDVVWVGVAEAFEDSSKVRDRLRVRNIKITRTPSFEISRLYRILIGRSTLNVLFFWLQNC